MTTVTAMPKSKQQSNNAIKSVALPLAKTGVKKVFDNVNNVKGKVPRCMVRVTATVDNNLSLTKSGKSGTTRQISQVKKASKQVTVKFVFRKATLHEKCPVASPNLSVVNFSFVTLTATSPVATETLTHLSSKCSSSIMFMSNINMLMCMIKPLLKN